VSISQTINEVGLERGIVAAWAEPRAGQALKPRFGSRPFPRKLIYVVLILVVCVGFTSWQHGQDAVTSAKWIVASLACAAVAWPLLVLLDRTSRRNVWVYTDKMIVTHARDRVVLPRAELKQTYLYRDSKTASLALELVLTNGNATVVGLPSDVEPTKLITTLRNIGYQVESNL
jgi:hypothetical protein